MRNNAMRLATNARRMWKRSTHGAMTLVKLVAKHGSAGATTPIPMRVPVIVPRATGEECMGQSLRASNPASPRTSILEAAEESAGLALLPRAGAVNREEEFQALAA
jgi:hypothetical protein